MTATRNALPRILTPHLVMREMRRADAHDLAAFLTQPQYHRHISQRLRDAEMVERFLERQLEAKQHPSRSNYHLAAEERMSREVVGEGFLIAQEANVFEIGWGVHPAMWSMGLGTEIGRALLSLAFESLGASSVWSKVMRENVASLRLAQRIGMRHSSSHERFPLGNSQYVPVDIFTLTSSEYFDLPY